MTEVIFTAREGKVLRRGVYLAEPSKLLATFERSAAKADWWAPHAAALAGELIDAITVAEDYHQAGEAA